MVPTFTGEVKISSIVETPSVIKNTSFLATCSLASLVSSFLIQCSPHQIIDMLFDCVVLNVDTIDHKSYQFYIPIMLYIAEQL